MDKDVKSFANIMLSRNNTNELISLHKFNEYYQYAPKDIPANIHGNQVKDVKAAILDNANI